ncbi:zinc ribbon domain-containing protein [Chitinispirillales bacterium ANBcel5]|uniref:FmdB family zinc ribbon protein n=1 Tax=Cellulosispirillum alkaliphilum TaxID=3039283 RepID=UPI002A56C54E|nr:zinc ribbon domain-containing protein [Chitinispirillales bacterium ANBcel5]
MPLFEYRCQNCDNFFEELITNEQNSNIKCPKCSSNKTVKQFSTIGAISMGSTSMPDCSGGCGSMPSCSTGAGCPHAM